jgi:hypothetical protein
VLARFVSPAKTVAQRMVENCVRSAKAKVVCWARPCSTAACSTAVWHPRVTRRCTARPSPFSNRQVLLVGTEFNHLIDAGACGRIGREYQQHNEDGPFVYWNAGGGGGGRFATAGDGPMDRALHATSTREPPAVPSARAPDGAAFLLYTGVVEDELEGAPRPLSHRQLVEHGVALSTLTNAAPSDVLMGSGIPLCSVAALMGVMLSMTAGCALVFQPVFSEVEFWDTCRAHQATLMQFLEADSPKGYCHTVPALLQAQRFGGDGQWDGLFEQGGWRQWYRHHVRCAFGSGLDLDEVWRF